MNGSKDKRMEDLVELAHEMARRAHEGQLDKGSVEYIRHPEYVAAQLEDPREKIVAYLHDILEDTDLKVETIKECFGEEISEAVRLLTHKKGEDYFEYIEKIKKNRLSMAVKIADLNHNCQVERIPHPRLRDYARIEKYKEALRILAE